MCFLPSSVGSHWLQEFLWFGPGQEGSVGRKAGLGQRLAHPSDSDGLRSRNGAILEDMGLFPMGKSAAALGYLFHADKCQCC